MKTCTTPNRHAISSTGSTSRIDISSVCDLCRINEHCQMKCADLYLLNLVLYHQPEKMLRSKEDLAERQENLERLKQQHGIEWHNGAYGIQFAVHEVATPLLYFRFGLGCGVLAFYYYGIHGSYSWTRMLLLEGWDSGLIQEMIPNGDSWNWTLSYEVVNYTVRHGIIDMIAVVLLANQITCKRIFYAQGLCMDWRSA